MTRPNNTKNNPSQINLEYKNTKYSIAGFPRDQLILQTLTSAESILKLLRILKFYICTLFYTVVDVLS